MNFKIEDSISIPIIPIKMSRCDEASIYFLGIIQKKPIHLRCFFVVLKVSPSLSTKSNALRFPQKLRRQKGAINPNILLKENFFLLNFYTNIMTDQ